MPVTEHHGRAARPDQALPLGLRRRGKSNRSSAEFQPADVLSAGHSGRGVGHGNGSKLMIFEPVKAQRGPQQFSARRTLQRELADLVQRYRNRQRLGQLSPFGQNS